MKLYEVTYQYEDCYDPNGVEIGIDVVRAGLSKYFKKAAKLQFKKGSFKILSVEEVKDGFKFSDPRQGSGHNVSILNVHYLRHIKHHKETIRNAIDELEVLNCNCGILHSFLEQMQKSGRELSVRQLNVVNKMIEGWNLERKGISTIYPYED
jgi:hypothetical protein